MSKELDPVFGPQLMACDHARHPRYHPRYLRPFQGMLEEWSTSGERGWLMPVESSDIVPQYEQCYSCVLREIFNFSTDPVERTCRVAQLARSNQTGIYFTGMGLNLDAISDLKIRGLASQIAEMSLHPWCAAHLGGNPAAWPFSWQAHGALSIDRRSAGMGTGCLYRLWLGCGGTSRPMVRGMLCSCLDDGDRVSRGVLTYDRNQWDDASRQLVNAPSLVEKR